MIAECQICLAFVECDMAGAFERIRGEGKSSVLISLLRCCK